MFEQAADFQADQAKLYIDKLVTLAEKREAERDELQAKLDAIAREADLAESDHTGTLRDLLPGKIEELLG